MSMVVDMVKMMEGEKNPSRPPRCSVVFVVMVEVGIALGSSWSLWSSWLIVMKGGHYGGWSWFVIILVDRGVGWSSWWLVIVEVEPGELALSCNPSYLGSNFRTEGWLEVEWLLPPGGMDSVTALAPLVGGLPRRL